MSEVNHKKLPRAISHTVLNFGNDIALCFRAVSKKMPESAQLFYMPKPPKVSGGLASRLVLSLTGSDQRVRNIVLDEISKVTEQKIIDMPGASIIVIEEDYAAPNNQRFIYTAHVSEWQKKAQ